MLELGAAVIADGLLDFTKRLLIRGVWVPGNASATGRPAACPGGADAARIGSGRAPKPEESSFKLYADRQTADFAICSAANSIGTLICLSRSSDWPEEAKLRRLSHPMDPRTVPLYVPREDRELVTNARCTADVDDKV